MLVKKVQISLFPVFFGQGCVQHEESEWRGIYWVRYHKYMYFWNRNLLDAFLFAYGSSIHVELRANALSVKKVDGSGEAEVAVEIPDYESSDDNGEENSELSSFNVKKKSNSQDEEE